MSFLTRKSLAGLRRRACAPCCSQRSAVRRPRRRSRRQSGRCRSREAGEARRARQVAAIRIRWRSTPTWRFGRSSSSCCCSASSASSPGRRLPRPWTSASGRSPTTSPPPRPDSRRPSELLAEHEAKLAAAAGEVRAMLEEARRDAEHTRKRIEANGHQAAKDELDRAVREIDRARDAAIQDLAVTSANVAIDLARKCRQDELTPERQNQIVREALGKARRSDSKQELKRVTARWMHARPTLERRSTKP